MKIIYANQFLQIEKFSAFLAGPTPRSKDVPSWRPEAISLFQRHNFEGTLLVPEDEDWGVKGNYDDQVAWEFEALEKADVIMFWIPRDLKTMPAMTTSVEFGMYLNSGKIILGAPLLAPKMDYLFWHAKRKGVPIVRTLEGTVINAIYYGHKWTTPWYQQLWTKVKRRCQNRWY